MDIKKLVIFVFVFILLISLVSAQRFFDYGYGAPGYYGGGFLNFGLGTGFIDSLCTQYGDWFEFFVLLIIFFVIGKWAFGSRPKSDLLAVAIAVALSLGVTRWGSRSGFSLVCGIGDVFGGAFGGISLIVLLFLIIWGFFALARGGNGAKAGVGLAYILFYFWLGSTGGYFFSDLFYLLPFDPYFVQSILNLLLLVAVFFVIIFGYRWYKQGRL